MDEKEMQCNFEMLSGPKLDNQVWFSGSAVLAGGQTPSLGSGKVGEAALGHLGALNALQ